MSIDIQQMIEMAREREGWVHHAHAHGAIPHHYIMGVDGQSVARVETGNDARFIAESPRAILALSERVAELEAQNATLQARAEALGEWQSPDESPPAAESEE